MRRLGARAGTGGGDAPDRAGDGAGAPFVQLRRPALRRRLCGRHHRPPLPPARLVRLCSSRHSHCGRGGDGAGNLAAGGRACLAVAGRDVLRRRPRARRRDCPLPPLPSARRAAGSDRGDGDAWRRRRVYRHQRARRPLAAARAARRRRPARLGRWPRAAAARDWSEAAHTLRLRAAAARRPNHLLCHRRVRRLHSRRPRLGQVALRGRGGRPPLSLFRARRRHRPSRAGLLVGDVFGCQRPLCVGGDVARGNAAQGGCAGVGLGRLPRHERRAARRRLRLRPRRAGGRGGGAPVARLRHCAAAGGRADSRGRGRRHRPDRLGARVWAAADECAAATAARLAADGEWSRAHEAVAVGRATLDRPPRPRDAARDDLQRPPLRPDRRCAARRPLRRLPLAPSPLPRQRAQVPPHQPLVPPACLAAAPRAGLSPAARRRHPPHRPRGLPVRWHRLAPLALRPPRVGAARARDALRLARPAGDAWHRALCVHPPPPPAPSAQGAWRQPARRRRFVADGRRALSRSRGGRRRRRGALAHRLHHLSARLRVAPRLVRRRARDGGARQRRVPDGGRGARELRGAAAAARLARQVVAPRGPFRLLHRRRREAQRRVARADAAAALAHRRGGCGRADELGGGGQGGVGGEGRGGGQGCGEWQRQQWRQRRQRRGRRGGGCVVAVWDGGRCCRRPEAKRGARGGCERRRRRRGW
mmetsp:Transcript_8529/g.28271  ORF Transcript_8529/g.28271 Transcript_8529/m.28271 type:complete len:704 (-) Transcript_8529:135-2246(-)